MPASGWIAAICIAGVLIVLAVIAVDRNRIRHRFDNAEGREAALSLEIRALRDQVTRLSAYLNKPSSWDVDAAPPRDLAAPEFDDRAAAPHADPAVVETTGSDTRAARRQPASESDGSSGPQRFVR